MENKKWTDADLRTAFEDGCKFINFKDLQDFLLERGQKVDTSERQLTIPAVVGQSEQLLAFAQYLHNHSYVNKGFKPETLVRRFKGE